MNLLRVDNLSVTYRTGGEAIPAVRGATLEIREKEMVSLVGESGSGKSTLGLAIGRLLPGAASTLSGEIFFRGEDVLLFSSEKIREFRRKHIAYVFQEPASSLNPVFRVRSQIEECLPRKSREKAEHYLALAQIPDPLRVAEAYPHELSGGMKQRAMIAMALAKNPNLLIADEPTTALDVTVQKEILRLFVSLKKERKLSILFITHDLQVAAAVSDRILVMQEGRIVEEITDTQKLSVAHPYSRKLLSCAMAGRKPKTLFEV